ncbi:transmembrane receptor protein tyrosine kinase [Mactra antiquata]
MTGSKVEYLVIIGIIFWYTAQVFGSPCVQNETSYQRLLTKTTFYNDSIRTEYTEVTPGEDCIFLKDLFSFIFTECKTQTITLYKYETRRVPKHETYYITECCLGYKKNESDICIKSCEPGKYGETCDKDCLCYNTSLYCDDDGQCICPVGLNGTNCTEECDTQHYGRNCEFKCECLNNSTCNRKDGTCNCTVPGFEGDLCGQKCNSSYFGLYCQQNCECNENQTCDSVDGTCTCLPGRTGDNCSQECNSGSYGIDCNKTCNCNENNTVSCNVTNGMCNCKPGYLGKHCDHVCKIGTYGQDCLLNCSDHCLPSQVCHFGNGTCYCLGSKGENCTEPCDKGTCGLNCSSSCDCNINNSNGECNSINGHCQCVDKWEGEMCNEEITTFMPTSKMLPDSIVGTDKLFLGLSKTDLMIIVISSGCFLVIIIIGGAIIYRKKTFQREIKTLKDRTKSVTNKAYNTQTGTMDEVITAMIECENESKQPNKDKKNVVEKSEKASLDKKDGGEENTELEPVIYEDVDEGDVDENITDKSRQITTTSNDKSIVAYGEEVIYDLANEIDQNDMSTQAAKTERLPSVRSNSKDLPNVTKVSVEKNKKNKDEDIDCVVYEDAEIEPEKLHKNDQTNDNDEDDYDTTCTNIIQSQKHPFQHDEVIYESADETDEPEQHNYNTFNEVRQKRLNSVDKRKVGQECEDDYNVLEHFPSQHRETRNIGENQYSSFDEAKSSGGNTNDSGGSDYDSLDYKPGKKKRMVNVLHDDYHHINLDNKTLDGENLVSKSVKTKSENDNGDEVVEKRSDKNDGVKYTCSDLSEQHYSVCDIDEPVSNIDMEEVIYDECDEPEEKIVNNVSDNTRTEVKQDIATTKQIQVTIGKVDSSKSDDCELYDSVSSGDTDNDSDDNDIDRESKSLDVVTTRNRRRTEDYEEYDLSS